jgi:predicted nucleic acid-binding protein
MNVIIDTSVWFEYFKGNEPYFSITQKLLNSFSVRIIDPIVGEILQGALNLKDIRFLRYNIQFISRTEISQLFEKAGEFSFRNKLLSKGIGLIDATIIFATIESGSVLWTLDKKILNFMDEKFLFQPE